ncbi:MAG: hypothetical protein GY716_02740 [bacterium]|nr:hypothetical protein [bacterium]
MTPTRIRDDPAAIGVILMLTPLAWLLRFVQDDAFISFRYAANWVGGHGPVFNPGEAVEGYTNFLWTALMTLPHALGADPVYFTELAGLVTFPLGLVATYSLTVTVFESAAVARLAVLLLGTNYSFVAWATGGLETSLHVCLVTACSAAVARALRRGWTPARALGISTLAGLAMLTRLDSAVLLTLPGVLALNGALRARSAARGVVIALFVPVLALVLPWLTWKTLYYGELLPNTYWVKLGGETLLRNGVSYLASFGLSYALAPIPLLLLIGRRRLVERAGATHCALLLGPPLLWSVYLLRAGGDFMEFRLLVAALPALAAATAWVVVELVPRPALRVAALVVLLGASVAHGVAFDRSPLRRPWIESVPQLRQWLDHPDYGWIGLGTSLRVFEPFERAGIPVRIAVTPAGAIPYYSGLRTVDMLGLSDRWVARHGPELGARAGHRRVATLEYLERRGVHLVIGHPQHMRRLPGGDLIDPAAVHALRLLPDARDLSDRARVVILPRDDSGGIVALYLTPHPGIDDLIHRFDWRVYGLRRSDARGSIPVKREASDTPR